MIFFSSKETDTPLLRRLSWAAILLLFVFTLFYFKDLGVRPMHNDEGVNAWFLGNLVRSNDYKYDPNNYHGPSLYYIQLIPTWITGLAKDGLHFGFSKTTGITRISVRAGTTVMGLLILLLLLAAHRRIGSVGAVAALLLLGTSCDFIYYSRYFIHEIFFVGFTFCLYLSAVYYRDTGRRRYLYLAAASASLVFATKETSIVNFFVLAFSGLLAHLFGRAEVSESQPDRPKLLSNENGVPFFIAFFTAFLIWIFLYTSFFKNLHGVIDSFTTYIKWTKEGVESGHNKVFRYFIDDILVRYELPLVVMTVVGLAAAFLQRSRSALYLAFWTLGMLGAYSVIPYKTPWCVLNMLLPMALISGFGFQTIYDKLSASSTERSYNLRVLGLVFGGLVLWQLPKTYKVNYVEYDAEAHPQAYVHTVRDIYNLVDKIDGIAHTSGLGNDMKINVVSTNYWPLPFYLRHYKQALFWGRFDNVGVVDAPIIIAEGNQKNGLAPYLHDTYTTRDYLLRPGTALVLYINQHIASGEIQKPALNLPAVLKSRPVTKRLLPGATRRVFTNPRFEGRPTETSILNQDISFWWNLEEQKPVRSPFSIQYSGFIHIAKPGAHTFWLESDDGSNLYIDDYLVVDNGGVHALEKKGQIVTLDAGYHSFRVDYFDSGGGAVLKLSWTPPGGAEEVIPASFLYTVNE